MTSKNARRLAHKERVERHRYEAFAAILTDAYFKKAGFVGIDDFVTWMQSGRSDTDIYTRFNVITIDADARQWLAEIRQFANKGFRHWLGELVNG